MVEMLRKGDEKDVEKAVHLLRILAMMYQGRFNAAEKKIGELDGAILKNHPSILFNLKQLKYYACLRGGRVVDALEVVRNEMSPLAIEHPDFYSQLWAMAGGALAQGTRVNGNFAPNIDSTMNRILKEVEVPSREVGLGTT
eukprot:jgi/Pico_ML_1/54999/g124.t1